MKKGLLSIAMAVVMFLSVGTTAFAAETPDSIDKTQIIGQCDEPTDIKCANKASAQSSPADSTDNTVDETQIIGQYDGPAFKIGNSNQATLLSIANVRVNSYATYSKDDGVQVHIELYVPWYEFQNPLFTSMGGTVSITMNNTTKTKSFFETANQSSTISTDVSTGVKGASGTKGNVNLSGYATGNNIENYRGPFMLSYPITIP